MYKSKEIRWFNTIIGNSIVEWFNKQNQSFENTEPRTDYYLPLAKDDVTVKLREGNIEIKHRTSEVLHGNLTDQTHGFFENWIRWSFKIDKLDKLSQQIILSNPNIWIKTIKTRMGVKITKDSVENKVLILPIKTIIDFGVQVEYTRLIIEEETYYTFGLEWFGNKILELDHRIIFDILGSTQLMSDNSMGYGKFLNQNFSNKQAF